MNIFSHKQDTYLDKDNAKIYYETLGDPKLPALLLLHGGVGNIEEFNKLIPSLVQSHFIIGIDSRGHGRSTLGTPRFKLSVTPGRCRVYSDPSWYKQTFSDWI